MEDILISTGSGLMTDQKIRNAYLGSAKSAEKEVNNNVLDLILSEGGESFCNYLKGLGLAGETNMMVLSSRHDFYYDINDLNAVRILINMKVLNRMRHLNSFIFTVSKALAVGSEFIGCFSDRRIREKVVTASKGFKRSGNYFDSGKNIEMDKADLYMLFEAHALRVIDMTEINSLTYFRVQKKSEEGKLNPVYDFLIEMLDEYSCKINENRN